MIESERTVEGGLLYGNTLSRDSCKLPSETVWCSTNDQPTGFFVEERFRSTTGLSLPGAPMHVPSCGQLNGQFSMCEADTEWEDAGAINRWISQDSEDDCQSTCDEFSKYGGTRKFNHCSGYVYFTESKACYLKPIKHDATPSTLYSLEKNKELLGPAVERKRSLFYPFAWADRTQLWASKGMLGPPKEGRQGHIRNQLFKWTDTNHPGELGPAAEPIDPLALELAVLEFSLGTARVLADAN